MQPSDQLLEIGCGHGIAVSLICDLMDGGRVTAIDRSPAMASSARRKNRETITSGKSEIRADALATADFGEQRFDKIFVFNVNAVLRASADLARIKDLLKPNGIFFLFHQPPARGMTRRLELQSREILENNGFSVEDARYGDLDPAPAVCLIARPLPGSAGE